MKASKLTTIQQLGGQIKEHDGVYVVWFDGSPDKPENALSIPLHDFGYTKQHGIFRKSLWPDYVSEINL